MMGLEARDRAVFSHGCCGSLEASQAAALPDLRPPAGNELRCPEKGFRNTSKKDLNRSTKLNKSEMMECRHEKERFHHMWLQHVSIYGNVLPLTKPA